jgi:hypothetical protein
MKDSWKKNKITDLSKNEDFLSLFTTHLVLQPI